MPKTIDQVFSYIDGHQQAFIDELALAIPIKSVSSSSEHLEDVMEMMRVVEKKIKDGLNGTTTLHPVGPDLPDVLLGLVPATPDPRKKTVCVYGHLDVQPAQESDGWNTDPFTMVVEDGKMFGRGTTDDKGPVYAWLHAVEAYQQSNVPLPVNLKLFFEGMEESGLSGVDDVIHELKDTFFKDIDYISISDNYWLGNVKPCITYGLRGLSYFHVKVSCATKDLHSGTFGGVVYEAVPDVMAMLNSLADAQGNILVPGVNDDVLPVTDEERELYKDIDFDPDAFRKQIGANKLRYGTKEDILMHRWRFASLTIHGMEGAFAEPGTKTVIPAEVIGKFSIRLVPNQDPVDVQEKVIKHLKQVHAWRGSTNPLEITCNAPANPWVGDHTDPNYTAGCIATKQVYNVEPDLIREGGSIPVTLTLTEVTGASAVLLSMGRSDDGAHSTNEKMDIENYIEGTKVLASYMDEVAKLSKGRKGRK